MLPNRAQLLPILYSESPGPNPLQVRCTYLNDPAVARGLVSHVADRTILLQARFIVANHHYT